MGQPVAVEQKVGGTSTIIRFETNRSLTGQGHENFTSAEQARGPRPAAVVARRMFDTGQVAGVHVYGNVISVSVKAGASNAGLDTIVRDLYQYWKPGMTPPSVEELLAQMPAETAPASAPETGGADDGRDPRIPAIIWERSKLGRERWNAKQG